MKKVESSEIDENSKIKQRIAIYAPAELNDRLIELATKTNTSRNQLALTILTKFINKNAVG